MRFTKSHEWISSGEGSFSKRVGITEFAQKELGEIVFVQLPKIGQVVRAGEEVCVIESTKAAADIYTPVSGKIISVNEAVAKEPQLINRFAESTGWLFEIALSDPKEEERLLSRAEYKKLVT